MCFGSHESEVYLLDLLSLEENSIRTVLFGHECVYLHASLKRVLDGGSRFHGVTTARQIVSEFIVY